MPVTGTGHKTLVAGLAVEGSDKVFSAAYDDTVKEVSGTEFVYAHPNLDINGTVD